MWPYFRRYLSLVKFCVCVFNAPPEIRQGYKFCTYKWFLYRKSHCVNQPVISKIQWQVCYVSPTIMLVGVCSLKTNVSASTVPVAHVTRIKQRSVYRKPCSVNNENKLTGAISLICLKKKINKTVWCVLWKTMKAYKLQLVQAVTWTTTHVIRVFL
jgi:hypothetical protein